MSRQAAWQLSLGFLAGKPVVVEPSEAELTSDAGLLPVRVFDERIGWTARLAEALLDPRRDPRHTSAEMLRMRLFGVLADYADQNDHDVLRYDPVFKLIAGRTPDEPPLASQPTLSRFENSIDIASLNRLRDAFLDNFIESFDEPPAYLTFDVDPFDDPTHGQQQPQRRRYFNRRRECDPLGGGQPGTWQTRLIKVAAEVVVSTRRVLIKLSPHWPHLHHYRHVGAAVHSIPSTAPG